MELPGKPGTIDDLYALADGAGYTIASNLQLHLALQDATAEELTRWFRENRSGPRGHDWIEAYRKLAVMDALEARAREVDPMILVDRLKDALAFNSPGFGGLERLPTEKVGKFIDEIPERYRLQFLQGHLNSLEGSSDQDLAALRLEILDRFATEDERASIREMMDRRWVSADKVPEDFEAARLFIEGLPTEQIEHGWRQFFAKLSKQRDHSPESLLALGRRSGLDEMPATVQRGYYREVGLAWAETDPEKAFEWANGLEADIRGGVMEDLVREVSRFDPVSAKNFLDSIPPEQRTMQSIENTVHEWLEIDPASAAKWAWSQPENLRGAFGRAASGWIANDPAGAVEWLTLRPEVLELNSYLVAGVLHNYDPLIAKEFATRLPSSELKSGIVGELAVVLGKENLTEAIAFAEGLEEPETRLTAIKSIAKSGVSSDPEHAVEWTNQLQGAERDAAMTALFQDEYGVRLNADRLAPVALEWLTSSSGDALWSDAAALTGIKAIAESLADRSASEAQGWVAQLPAGPAQDAAISGIAESLAAISPVAAAEWIAELPASNARDDASAQLIRNLPNDPESALIWATNIGDESKRLKALKSVVNDWSAYDSAAAKVAIDTARLSVVEKALILKEIQK